MSEPSGVSPDDMSPSPLSDDELEALLFGSGEGGHPVADFLADARASFLDVPVGDPSPELIRAMEQGPMSPPLSDGADVIDLVAASEASRRTRMIGTFASFAGTAVGKIAIGSAAAAVSFAAGRDRSRRWRHARALWAHPTTSAGPPRSASQRRRFGRQTGRSDVARSLAKAG